MKHPPSGAARALLNILCCGLAVLAFWSGALTLSNWDDLWSGGDFYSSYSIYHPTSVYESSVEKLMELRKRLEWSGSLSYSDREQMKALEERLDPANTNFRYQIHDQESSELLDGNYAGNLEDLAAPSRYVFTIQYGTDLRDGDHQEWSTEQERSILYVKTLEGAKALEPESFAAGEYSQYDWRFDGEAWNEYDEAYDTRVRSQTVALDYGVTRPLTVHDEYWTAMENYNEIQRFLPVIAVTALVTLCLTAAVTALLCRTAGYRRGEEGLRLGWQDRVPLDIYLAADCLLAALILSAGDQAAWSFNRYGNPASIVGISLFSALGAAVALAALQTLAVRIRRGGLLRNTAVWRVCAAAGRVCHDVFHSWSVTKRTVCLFLLYLLGTVLSGVTLMLIPVYQGVVLWWLCRWTLQWRSVRMGAAEITGGNPDYKIDTKKMYPTLREHAAQLNDLGSAIGNAVDEQLKSERFKAELITNVSHDLKTPLTSIINYVDLLKKTDIQDPKALEYIEVLDRKSQRLKKLTEDLVEASKASTGNLTVEREKLGFIQLLDQALGEYEEKFENCGLTPILSQPEGEVYVEADGRHLWRVVDNLLGNCVKYALPGTRVYLDVRRWDGNVTLSIKNISREALNLPADQLMERFVRGDASRTAEGSGLGLSIARSLTELQGGAFRLDIDGDLFKAVITFPEYKEPIPLPKPPDAG